MQAGQDWRTGAAALARKTAAFGRVFTYSLLAFAIRLLLARAFFRAGQGMIDGPELCLRLPIWNLDFAVVLPQEIKPAILQQFESQYANLPISPSAAAYLFGYAEFVLPICLVLGFATRIAALGLLGLTTLLQIYVAPEMWWHEHAYWVVLLAVLLCLGPGGLSTDAVLRRLYRWERL
jgi:putative oxidoreductase